MKAFKVTTKTQEFIVTAEAMAEVLKAYADCEDLESVRLLGDVIPLPKSVPTEKDNGISVLDAPTGYVPFRGSITEVEARKKAILHSAFIALITYAENPNTPSFPLLHNTLDDVFMYLKTRGFFNL